MINDRQLVNLGLVCLLATSPTRIHKEVADSTLFQDTRLTIESKLLALIDKNWFKLELYKYVQKVYYKDAMNESFIRGELEAQLVNTLRYDRQIVPLYSHRPDNLYIVNPNEGEEMYLYYGLSPSMVIEVSRYLLDVPVWFLGHHEVMSSESLGDVVLDIKKKYLDKKMPDGSGHISSW